jgi:hypothetical protein
MTKIVDVIVPEVFLPYMEERTAELTNVINSGILVRDAEWDAKATLAGKLQEMPFWQDLDGADEVLSDSGSLTVGKITTSKDVSRNHFRGKAWGANDLARHLAGDDPMRAIAELVAEYRSRRLQAQTISTLKGIFGAASMSDNLLDIHMASGTPTSANYLTGATFVDACQKMGDSKSKLVAVMMHSAVEAHLLKLDLIDYIPDSEGKSLISTFQGKRVIIDDGLPTETIDGRTVYSTFLFGAGALAYGVGSDNSPVEGGIGTWQLEMSREALASESYLITRWKNIIHPRGVKWLESSVAGVSPTNAELENQANWQRVFESKNVRIVKVRHNIVG